MTSLPIKVVNEQVNSMINYDLDGISVTPY
jgi:hypothetical protein